MMVWDFYCHHCLCNHDGCRCPDTISAPGHRQPPHWLGSGCMVIWTYYVTYRVTVAKQNVRSREVGDALVSLPLAGSSSQGNKALCQVIQFGTTRIHPSRKLGAQYPSEHTNLLEWEWMDCLAHLPMLELMITQYHRAYCTEIWA